jgi:hypothetical protein
MVDPSVHKRVSVHGVLFPDPTKGIRQIHTSVGHLKEWRNLGKYEVEFRAPENFKTEKFDIRGIGEAYPWQPYGTDIYYDHELKTWMEYVANRSKNYEGLADFGVQATLQAPTTS